ncbi:hypothetical protein GOODEAATRI_014169 [Goodea atripinnis]|uniref:Uncharacterized protein n=1 Tax=Goodea atripinnis TaxID=208336 RepID=A0ABV0NUE1_9TELE
MAEFSINIQSFSSVEVWSQDISPFFHCRNFQSSAHFNTILPELFQFPRPTLSWIKVPGLGLGLSHYPRLVEGRVYVLSKDDWWTLSCSFLTFTHLPYLRLACCFLLYM